MCFRCASDYHFIKKIPKPDTLDNKVHWNTKKPKTCAYRSTKIDKTSENSTYKGKSHKIHTSITRMYTNVESCEISFGDNSQLTNYSLDSGATFHMTPENFGFYAGLVGEKR